MYMVKQRQSSFQVRAREIVLVGPGEAFFELLLPSCGYF